jgi:hypothetical protein
VSYEERFWPRRLRWRLRGAWQWPAFALFTLADAFVLNLLPPIRTGVDFVPALILASFGNLFLVGLVAPWLTRRASGLATRPLVVSETRATEENARLVRSFVEARGSDEVKRNLDTANTRRLAEGYFRTCIALDDRTRAYCLFVDTNSGSVRRDRDSRPNAVAIR